MTNLGKLALLILIIVLAGAGFLIFKPNNSIAPGPIPEPIASAGFVAGHVTIGPFCPVEQVGHPCTVPPEAYTSREAVVYASDQTTVKERVHLDTQGNYKIAIGPGNYFVQIVPAGIGPGEKKAFTVVSYKTTTVDFDIDTGIR
jgi:hypothetical protein